MDNPDEFLKHRLAQSHNPLTSLRALRATFSTDVAETREIWLRVTGTSDSLREQNGRLFDELAPELELSPEAFRERQNQTSGRVILSGIICLFIAMIFALLAVGSAFHPASEVFSVAAKIAGFVWIPLVIAGAMMRVGKQE